MNNRIVNLDFIRGFCVLLAMVQHTFYYNNTIFMDIDYHSFAAPIIHYMNPYLNKLIPLDGVAVWFLNTFMMWVSHIYIFLSAINLSKRKRQDFNLSSKLKIFSILFMIFFIESMIIGNNLGEMLTLHPLMTWMILLSIISIIYKYFDILGVALSTFIIMIGTYVVNDIGIGNYIETMLQVSIHNELLYDARIESFAMTAFLGFLMGYGYHHYNSSRKYIYFMIFSLGFFLIAKLNGSVMYTAEAQSMYENFRNEGFYYFNINNLLYIQSILIFIVTIALWLERKKIVINIGFINFISINSLFIFAIHKIVILKIIIPIRIVIYSYTGWLFDNTAFIAFIYSFLVTGLVWLILKLKIPKIISRSEDKNYEEQSK